MTRTVTVLTCFALITGLSGCSSLNGSTGEGGYAVVERSARESRDLFGFWNFNGSPENEIPDGSPLLMAHAPVGGHFWDDREEGEFFENTKYHLTESRLIYEFRPEVHQAWDADSSDSDMRHDLVNQYLSAFVPVPEINLDLFTVAFRFRLFPSSANFVDSDGNPVGQRSEVLHMGFLGHSWVVSAVQDGPSGPFTLHVILHDTKRDDRLRYDTGVTISTDSETEIVLTVDNSDHTLNIYRNGEHFTHEIERIREWGHCPSGGAKNTMLRPAPFFAERMEFDWLAIMNGAWDYAEIEELKERHLVR